MTELLSKAAGGCFWFYQQKLGAPCLDFETWEIATLNCFVSGHDFSSAERARI